MEYILWAGTQESYDAYVNLQKFLTDPKYLTDSKSNMSAFGFDDDDDDDERSHAYDGMGSHMITVNEGVAVISVDGSLTNSYSHWNRYFGVVSYAEIRSAIGMVTADDNIKSVIVKYNTGGGVVDGIDETAQFLIEAKKTKEIISYTSTAALSGGYWLAATGSKFYAAKTARVGSVGVIQIQASQQRQYAEQGVDFNIIRAGKNKALGHNLEPLSKKGREVLQASVDKVYGFFTEHVAQMRNISISSRGVWAEGNVFYADEARALNLVDGVTYFDDLSVRLRRNINNSLLSEQELNTEVDVMTKKKIVSSEKDLAKLQSGVSSDVETTEGDDVAAEDVTQTEETSEDVTQTEETSEDVTPTEATEESASVTAQMLSETQDKLIDVSTKLAISEKALADLQVKVDAQDKSIVLLADAVSTATNRLQISLNQSPTKLAGLPAASVLDQWINANEDFSKTFKIGVQSKAAKTESDTEKLTPKTNIRAVED